MLKKRLYNLDIIKYISAILIVFHHYQQITNSYFNGINFFSGSVNFGFLVELFFLISGFVTEYGSNNIKNFNDVRLFLLKKFIRIYPFVWISMIFYCLFLFLHKNIINKSFEVDLFDKDYGLINYLASYLLIFSGWFRGLLLPAVNSPTWYLCVLNLCYIIFSITSLLQKKYDKLKIGLFFNYCCCFDNWKKIEYQVHFFL